MALPLLHAGTGAGGVPDVGALKWASGGAFVWSDDDYIVPSLDLNFALFKDIRPRIGPTPSFTRASTGTYFDESGVLTTAAINGPRFDHVYNGFSWVSKGLLVEELRTNSCRSSGDLANATYWQRNTSGSGQSVTANSDAAPDGTNTAALIVNGTGPYWIGNSASITYTNGTAYTFSVWIKRKSGTGNVWINTNPYGSGGIWLVLTITSEWVRYSVTHTATATTTPAQAPGVYVNQAGQEVYVWGAQLETGSFPTSYIPTTSASVTRSADVCQITGTDFSGFWNASESSLAVEYDLASTIPAQAIFYANDGTVSNCFRLYVWLFTLGSPSTDFYSRTASVTDGAIVLASTSPSAGKVAIGQKLNDLAGSLNGAAVVTDTSVVMPTGLSRLDLGIDHIGTRMNGHLARLRYYNTRLTNSQLQVLST